MRTKALLVAARAGFVGPVVILDGGVWEISKHPSVLVSWDGEVDAEKDNGVLRIRGPVRITTRVLETHKGPDVHLDARQISRA